MQIYMFFKSDNYMFLQNMRLVTKKKLLLMLKIIAYLFFYKQKNKRLFFYSLTKRCLLSTAIILSTFGIRILKYPTIQVLRSPFVHKKFQEKFTSENYLLQNSISMRSCSKLTNLFNYKFSLFLFLTNAIILNSNVPKTVIFRHAIKITL